MHIERNISPFVDVASPLFQARPNQLTSFANPCQLGLEKRRERGSVRCYFRYNCVRAVWKGLALKKPPGFNEANSLGPSDPAGVIFKRPLCVPVPNSTGASQEALPFKKNGEG